MFNAAACLLTCGMHVMFIALDLPSRGVLTSKDCLRLHNDCDRQHALMLCGQEALLWCPGLGCKVFERYTLSYMLAYSSAESRSLILMC